MVTENDISGISDEEKLSMDGAVVA